MKQKYLPIPTLTESDLARFWSKVDKRGPNDCWEWIASLRNGYGQFKLDGSSYQAHRISYAIANEDPGDICVCHTCDNPLCTNTSHLWLGTQQENNQDKVEKERQARGESHGLVKLSEEQVQEILESNESQQALADYYGVTVQTISLIKTGITWGHTKGERNTNETLELTVKLS